MQTPKLSDFLRRRNGALETLLSRAELLVRVNRTFREWQQEPWADSVRIVKIDGEATVFHTANAAAATQLRFRTPELLAWVRKHYNPACLEISVKVRPSR